MEDTKPLVHDFKGGKTATIPSESIFSGRTIGVLAAFVVLGVLTGYLLSGGPKPGQSTTSSTGGSALSKGTIIGSDDTSTYKDPAEGKMEKGGIEGEGSFHLVRGNDKSQYVYLTSSTIDLAQFVGRKVKVWGETQTAMKAGWLMDVGRVEVLE